MWFIDKLEPVEIDPRYIFFLLLRKLVDWVNRLGLLIVLLSLIFGLLVLFTLFTDTSYSFNNKLDLLTKNPIVLLPLQGLILGLALHGFASIAWPYLNNILSSIYEELWNRDEKWLKEIRKKKNNPRSDFKKLFVDMLREVKAVDFKSNTSHENR